MLMFGTQFNGEKPKVNLGLFLLRWTISDFLVTHLKHHFLYNQDKVCIEHTKSFWRKSLTLVISKVTKFVLKSNHLFHWIHSSHKYLSNTYHEHGEERHDDSVMHSSLNELSPKEVKYLEQSICVWRKDGSSGTKWTCPPTQILITFPKQYPSRHPV